MCISEAFKKAYESDPVSVFGGIIAANRKIDRATAEQISKIFIEIVAAPGFTDEALEILTQKKNIRLLRIDGISEPCVSTYTAKRWTAVCWFRSRTACCLTKASLRW